MPVKEFSPSDVLSLTQDALRAVGLQESLAVLLAQLIVCDVLSNKVQSHFAKQLEATRNDVSGANGLLKGTGPEVEQNQQNCKHDQTNHHDSVDGKWSALKGDNLRVELHDRRWVETALFGRKQSQCTKQLHTPGSGGVVNPAGGLRNSSKVYRTNSCSKPRNRKN